MDDVEHVYVPPSRVDEVACAYAQAVPVSALDDDLEVRVGQLDARREGHGPAV